MGKLIVAVGLMAGMYACTANRTTNDAEKALGECDDLKPAEGYFTEAYVVAEYDNPNWDDPCGEMDDDDAIVACFEEASRWDRWMVCTRAPLCDKPEGVYFPEAFIHENHGAPNWNDICGEDYTGQERRACFAEGRAWGMWLECAEADSCERPAGDYFTTAYILENHGAPNWNDICGEDHEGDEQNACFAEGRAWGQWLSCLDGEEPAPPVPECSKPEGSFFDEAYIREFHGMPNWDDLCGEQSDDDAIITCFEEASEWTRWLDCEQAPRCDKPDGIYFSEAYIHLDHGAPNWNDLCGEDHEGDAQNACFAEGDAWGVWLECVGADECARPDGDYFALTYILEEFGAPNFDDLCAEDYGDDDGELRACFEEIEAWGRWLTCIEG